MPLKKVEDDSRFSYDSEVMERISQWLEQSCLTLNSGKTEGRFKKKMNVCPPNADVFINDDKIKIVTEFTESKSQF